MSVAHWMMRDSLAAAHRAPGMFHIEPGPAGADTA